MRILTVYNTCGIKHEEPMHYVRCIESLLAQNHTEHKVVVSSCLNTDMCIDYVKNSLSQDVPIYRYREAHTVNITFNKTVIEAVKEFGEFDGYIFVDSGVSFHLPNIVSEMVARLEKFGIVSMQTDTDTGYAHLGLMHDSIEVQIKDEDLVLPVGAAVNAHVVGFHKDMFTRFGKIIPDVFAAYCTESAYPFVALSVDRRWVIVKDILLAHSKAIDGPSAGQRHISPIHNNTWNNLLYNRNALDFINDEGARQAGLGYEECANIMNHLESAYTEDGLAKDKDLLSEYVEKYFFLNKEELDYESIVTVRQ